MKKIMKSAMLLAAAVLALASCNKAAKMAELMEQVKIDCNPEVLEVIAGQIDADVAVTFPAEYFHPKAELEVLPIIVYEGGEAVGNAFRYQGSKVQDNFKTVSEDGATIQEHVNFAYVPGMEKSQLVARCKVLYKGNEYPFPQDIKIADGVNTTYMLVDQRGAYHAMADKYQDVIPESAEGQILYMINSDNVRASELKSADIKGYEAALKDLMNDERRTITGTELIAYASPDGPEGLNNKLADKREASAKKAFDKITKKLETGEVSSKSVGEDWEGFQELVNNSNIEDKDLIIRVLSMYSDPNVREREIKNMSSVYKSLAKDILPELRRARFVTSVEYQNYTADELNALVENNIDVLDEEALLRAATLTNDPAAKHAIYNQAIKKFDSDRAKYNSAITYLDENKNSEAKAMVEKMNNKKPCCVGNVLGVVAMRAGDYEKAAKEITGDCKHSKANKAVLDILNGKYDDAAAKLKGTNTYNEALVNVLQGKLDEASKILEGMDCPNSSYLKAIIASRKGDAAAAQKNLEQASKCEKLAGRVAKDIEFAKIR